MKEEYIFEEIEGTPCNEENDWEKWLVEIKQKTGYNGCKNCLHQIEPLRACDWLEHGGDGKFHLTCPRWEKRIKEKE